MVKIATMCAVLALAVPSLASARPTGWSDAERIPTSGTQPWQLAPELAVGPRGTAVAVWAACDGFEEVGSTEGPLRYCPELRSAARLHAEQAWRSLPTLGGGRSYAAYDVAVDASGDAVAAWVLRPARAKPFESGYELRVATSAALEQWRVAGRRLAAGCTTILDIAVASGARGDAIVAWTCWTTARRWVVQAVRRRAEGTWGLVRSLTAPRNAVFDLTLAADANGNALATWLADVRGGTALEASAGSARTGRWTAPRRLSGLSASFSDAEVNALGEAVVAWRDEQGISAVQRRAGRWSAPTRVGPSGIDVSVAMSSRGVPVVVWPEAGPGLSGERLQVVSRQRRWTRPRTLSASAAARAALLAAAEESGQVVVAWHEFTPECPSHPRCMATRLARRTSRGYWEPLGALPGRIDALGAWQSGRAVALWRSREDDVPTTLLAAAFTP